MKRSLAALAIPAILFGLVATAAPPAASADDGSDPSLLSANTYRFGGDTRYDVAINVSGEWTTGADTVFVAKGTDYPDALSAAAVAAHVGGPLLLTTSDQLLPAVATRIQELAPSRIVIVGGPVSIEPSVADALSSLAPEVERVSGADRYDVSRNLVSQAFDSASVVYVATGSTFPDALSASPAAANADSPVVLVNGGGAGVDAATGQLLARLNPGEIIIVGGPNSVSAGVEAGLGQYATVTRISGADRYEASRNVNSFAFGSASRVFFATGRSFADALAGGALAGLQKQPLLVVPGDCVTQAAADLVNGRFASAQRVILGGPNSVSDRVFSLNVCAPPAPPSDPNPPNPPAQPANPGDTKNCGDFATYAEAKAWFDTYYPYYGDIARLDNDNDLIPCENLPGHP